MYLIVLALHQQGMAIYRHACSSSFCKRADESTMLPWSLPLDVGHLPRSRQPPSTPCQLARSAA
jgi:hypothetical protein